MGVGTLAGQHSQVGCSKSETLQDLDVHGRTLIKDNVAYITTRTADMDFTWVDRNTTIVLNCVPSASDEIKLPQATSHNVGMVIKLMVALSTTAAFNIGVLDGSDTLLIGGLVFSGDADEGAALMGHQNALSSDSYQGIDLDGNDPLKGGDAGTRINFTYVAPDRIVVDGIVTSDVDSLTGANSFTINGFTA